MTRRRIRKTGEAGYRIATAGMILGYLSIALALLVFVAVTVPGASSSR